MRPRTDSGWQKCATPRLPGATGASGWISIGALARSVDHRMDQKASSDSSMMSSVVALAISSSAAIFGRTCAVKNFAAATLPS